MRSPKALLIQMLQHRTFGLPAAIICNSVRARGLSRKISSLCGYVPRVVPVRIPDSVKSVNGASEIKLYSARGLDQVARPLWWHGWDGFEKPLPLLFAAAVRGAHCVLDVGAYSGFYALIAASCATQAAVFAFEPYPGVWPWLEANVKLNKLADRIQIIRAAASDESGEVELYVPAAATNLVESASSLNPAHCGEVAEIVRTPVVTLDEFVAANNCRPVDVMKIDVETQEHRVLRGAQRILERDRPIIMLEVLESADVDELEAVGANNDYVCGVLCEDEVRWCDVVQADARCPSQVFCPVEKVRRLEEITDSM